jgi:hypothetical protein
MDNPAMTGMIQPSLATMEVRISVNVFTISISLRLKPEATSLFTHNVRATDISPL